MDFFHAMRNKRHNRLKNLHLDIFGFRIEKKDLVIIKVPNSRVLKLMMTLALFLSFVFVLSLPWINILTVHPPPPHAAGKAVKTGFPDHQLGQINPNPNPNPKPNPNLLLQQLFRYLGNEGLLKMGSDRALSVTGGGNNAGFIRNREAAVGRRLLGLLPNIDQAKKAAALSNLEDVLLEPPRAASGKSSKYFKRTRYLPDLIGDSLESYRRRVFINVHLSGSNDATTNDPNWFSDHYPTRNKKFEIYNIETVPVQGKTSSILSIPQVVGMSDWLKKNVQENEYVVMKAEAEVVEEMIKSGAIKLVDELFLECKHRGIKKGCKRSRRAYWECLALYGMLRDEGVAVHQWWG